MGRLDRPLGRHIPPMTKTLTTISDGDEGCEGKQRCLMGAEKEDLARSLLRCYVKVVQIGGTIRDDESRNVTLGLVLAMQAGEYFYAT